MCACVPVGWVRQYGPRTNLLHDAQRILILLHFAFIHVIFLKEEQVLPPLPVVKMMLEKVPGLQVRPLKPNECFLDTNEVESSNLLNGSLHTRDMCVSFKTFDWL